MKVPVEVLLKKIATFPENYTEGVKITQKGATITAVVKSWSRLDGEAYTVSLKRHKEDVGEVEVKLLDGTCTCPSLMVCKHMAQVYAVYKGITPEMAKEMVGGEPEQSSEQSLEEWRVGVHKAVDALIDAVIEQARTKEE